MKAINIGVLSPSNIAFRRTVPAILNSDLVHYVGVALSNKEERGNDASYEEAHKIELEKSKEFQEKFGGKVYNSFSELLSDKDVDAIYIPLPPNLHKKWAIEALNKGKHVLLEKPFTTSVEDTKEVIDLANKLGLIAHENYAFLYHKQIDELKRLVDEKVIGDLRVIRTSFSFPYRGENDFRYYSKLGGGALTDCGGYPLRLGTYFLKTKPTNVKSYLCRVPKHDVDMYGGAILSNDEVIVEAYWGMDNAYRCNVELYGSRGYASTDRVYSPPAGYEATIHLNIDGVDSEIKVEGDDQFQNSVEHFVKCINGILKPDYESIIYQANLIELIAKENK